MRWWVVLVLATACARSNSVECGDVVCPVDNVCDAVHGLCVSEEQATVCIGMVDGAHCTTAAAVGICDSGYCIPGCGDGISGPGEQCDDGDFASHDGCSSTCLLEVPTWTQWRDPWQGRINHGAAFDSVRGRLVITAGSRGAMPLTETWERTVAGAWEQVAPAPFPERSAAAMAYDTNRHVTVLFGGTGIGGDERGDTWEYDGTTWREITTTTAPSARYGAAIGFDPVRNVIVLFGGFSGNAFMNDTWEYTASGWSEITTTGSKPLNRVNAAMVWHPSRGKLVLFGGTDYNNNRHNDLYEYASGAWASVATTNPPPPRASMALGYLPGADKLVVFGGASPSEDVLGDTWELTGTGTAWSLALGSTNPPRRSLATLTSDGAKLVLVGGAPDATTVEPYRDVWEYTASGWAERTPYNAPTPRVSRIATDNAGRAIVFGGQDELFGGTNDTWVFADGQWTETTPSASPPERILFPLTYDSARDRVVMFGGFSYSTSVIRDDTWEYDPTANAWSERTSAQHPSPRAGASLAYDSSRGVTVLFGGTINAQLDVIGDTWELGAAGWAQQSTDGPPATGRPAIAYDPIGDRTVQFDALGRTWEYRAGTWTELATMDAPSPRDDVALAWDPNRERVILYGGQGTDGSFFDETWELDGSTWSRVNVVGPRPPTRRYPSITSDPRHRAMLLFGGRGGNGLYNDTWSLRYESGTADEQCDNGIDDDGDKQIDSSDPDCVGR